MSEPAKVPRPPGASRYGWFVGLALVLLIAVVTLNTLNTGDERVSSRGLARGKAMPPFAVPLALGPLEGDANVATKNNEGDAGDRPACQVRGPQILNVCQLYERGPVALAFFATRGAQCEDEVDRLQAAVGEVPVQVAAVAIRGDRGDLRRDIRKRGWRFPVGYDRDGVLATRYGVAVCPQITLADRGGRVRATLIGRHSTAALRRELRRLVRQ